MTPDHPHWMDQPRDDEGQWTEEEDVARAKKNDNDADQTPDPEATSPVADASDGDAVDSTEFTSTSSETPSPGGDADPFAGGVTTGDTTTPTTDGDAQDDSDAGSVPPESAPSSDSETNTDPDTTPDAHTQAASGPDQLGPLEDSQQTAAAGYGYGGVTTGVAGEAFPDQGEVTPSDQTQTVTSVITGEEYEQPKFFSRTDARGVHLAPYGWVGTEALFVAADDLDDFKAFVAGL